MSNHATSPSRANVALVLAILLAGLWAVLGLTAPDASGVAAKEIGKTAKTPKPSCPSPRNSDGEIKPNTPEWKLCQGVGELTGLQVRADGEVNPYKVPANGRIVAWSIDLARPDQTEVNFFSEAPAGGPDVEQGVGWGEPSAKISILKKKKHQRFKLVKQSKKVALKSHFGSTPIFTLRKPMRVKAGLFVALTAPGWFPALAHSQPVTSTNGDQWLASRGAKHCGSFPANASEAEIIKAQQDAIDHSKPQQKKGTVRPYKCRYTAARLLYRAFLVPDKK
jgi:hypothetical protein